VIGIVYSIGSDELPILYRCQLRISVGLLCGVHDGAGVPFTGSERIAIRYRASNLEHDF
jgi:hypothetical protein